MMLRRAGLLAALFHCAAAQIVGLDVPGSAINLYGGSPLCNHSFADGNASGVVTFNPNLAQGQQASGGTTFSTPFSWALTLLQPSNVPANQRRTDLSLWASTNGANYSNNFALGYDACYFWLKSLQLNTMYRGQDDDGTCSSTLNSACINDLQEAASQAAQRLVGELDPLSNLTSTSLPGVCASIAAIVTSNFPSSCAVFFNGPGGLKGGAPQGGPLTGPTSLLSASQCTSNGTYHLLWSHFEAATDTQYAAWSWWVTAVMTTFLPIADSSRTASITFPRSILSCVRAKNLNPGSVAPPPAQAAVPIDTSSSNGSSTNSNNTSTSGSGAASSSTAGTSAQSLSGGAIAGIVIGTLVGLALLAVAFLFVRRFAFGPGSHERQQTISGTSQAAVGGHDRPAELGNYRRMIEAPHGHALYEMHVPPVELHERNQDPRELSA